MKVNKGRKFKMLLNKQRNDFEKKRAYLTIV